MDRPLTTRERAVLDALLSPSLAETREALVRFAARPRQLLVYGHLVDAVRGSPAGRRCRNLEKN